MFYMFFRSSLGKVWLCHNCFVIVRYLWQILGKRVFLSPLSTSSPEKPILNRVNYFILFHDCNFPTTRKLWNIDILTRTTYSKNLIICFKKKMTEQRSFHFLEIFLGFMWKWMFLYCKCINVQILNKFSEQGVEELPKNNANFFEILYLKKSYLWFWAFYIFQYILYQPLVNFHKSE